MAAPSSLVLEPHLTRWRQQHEISAGIRACLAPVDDNPSWRQIIRVAHHEAGCGHAQAGIEREDYRVAESACVIADTTEARRKSTKAHAVALTEPLVANAGADHQGGSCLVLVLVGEEIEDRPDEIGSDPAVRHIAEK